MSKEIKLNYKFHSWVIKTERTPIADVEGHVVAFNTGGWRWTPKTGQVVKLWVTLK
jgi:hypothetical protein